MIHHAMARCLRSGCPCGSKANCDTLAPTNNIADEFLHAATQAPQPMQVAASNASSAISFPIGRLFASCAFPVFTEINPPADIILSKDDLSTAKSLMTGKAAARHALPQSHPRL